MSHTILWVLFVALVLGMLFLDLFVLNRKAHEVSLKQALVQTGCFVAIGALFAGAIYAIYLHDLGDRGTMFAHKFSTHAMDAAREAKIAGVELPPIESRPPITDFHAFARDASLQYLSGWITEYALSVDNIFVIALIFTYFRIPNKYQHRVLFWGIMGALILRGLMIGVGAAAVERFQWILYIFGAFLIFTAIKMVLANEDEEPNPEEMFVYKAVTRFIRVTPQLDGEKFITRVPQTEGSSTLVKAATPLFLVLVLVEFTDVIFAVDSIPAIFGITRDPFIVFTSNVFAILGLRSLYFALAGAMGLFKYLKPALAFVLAFIGVTMLLHMWHIDLPTWVKLATIASALTIGVGASLLHANKQRKLAAANPPANDNPAKAE